MNTSRSIHAEAKAQLVVAAVESAANAVMITDRKGRIEWVNGVFSRLTGYRRADVIGQSARLLKSGCHTEDFYRDLWNTILAGQVWHGEMTSRCRDGALYTEDVTITPVADDSGEIGHFIAIKQDITSRKHAEQALERTVKHQEELNRLQKDLLGPGVLDEKLKKVTDGAVQMLGADLCQIWVSKAGDRCKTGCKHAFVPNGPCVCGTRDRCLHLAASSGGSAHFDREVDLRLPFGCCEIGRLAAGASHSLVARDAGAEPPVRDWLKTLLPVCFAGYQLRLPGGEVIGVLAVFRQRCIIPEEASVCETLANISTQILHSAKAEDERSMLLVQLSQAHRLEAVGSLAAGIAHEINTPTQFVGDNLHFLQTAFPKLRNVLDRYAKLAEAAQAGFLSPELIDEAKQAARDAKIEFLLDQIPEAIGDSLDGVGRVARIVRAMKDFSHPGQNEKVDADLNKAIQSTITVARNEWKYVADMVMDLDPALPPVRCVLGDINQVILNVIVNAAHAIADVVGDGGRGKGAITVSTRQTGNEAEIRIHDTGAGIPEQHRHRVFEHFFTTKEVGKGTGQGLALAYSVITEAHHGSLTFESEVGKGTTFIIRLPIEDRTGDSKGTLEHEALHSIC